MTMFTRCAGLMLAIAVLGAPLAAQAQQTRTLYLFRPGIPTHPSGSTGSSPGFLTIPVD